MNPTQVQMLGVRIDDFSMDLALERAKKFLQEPEFHQIVTLGPEFLLEATAHERFRKILNRSDLALPEGMGLKVGSLLTGRRLKHRVPGVDFVDGLMGLAREGKYRVFLYGSRPKVVERAAHALQKRYPGLAIVGIESGYRGPWQRLHDHRIIEKIHRSKPDILLVALGAPKQELWIDRHRSALHDVRIAIGVGRTFDYLAGTIQRAPRLVRNFGFEWLHTWLFARRYHQPEFRRQRVQHATWNFITTLIRHAKY